MIYKKMLETLFKKNFRKILEKKKKKTIYIALFTGYFKENTIHYCKMFRTLFCTMFIV